MNLKLLSSAATIVISCSMMSCARVSPTAASSAKIMANVPQNKIQSSSSPCATLVCSGDTITINASSFHLVLIADCCPHPPTIADAGPDQSIYDTGAAQLAANTPVYGIGVWSVSGPSSSLAQFSNINDPAAIFTPDVVGAFELTWTISNAPYPSSSDSLVLNVTVSSFVISGKIIWEANRLTTMSGVTGVTVTLTGAENQTSTTTADGLYSFTVSTAGNYNISASRNSIPGAMNGVTTSDATRIQQHVIGALPLTDPYKLLAADVNNSNSVTASDVTFVQQAVLGNPIALSLFQNRTWICVPEGYVFPNPLAPWNPNMVIALTGVSTSQTALNFIAVKIGDVNASANPGI